MPSATDELRRIQTDTSSLVSLADRHLERSGDLMDQLEEFGYRVSIAQYNAASMTTEKIEDLNYELRALRTTLETRLKEQSKAIEHLSNSITDHGALSLVGTIYAGLFGLMGAVILGASIERAAETLAASRKNIGSHTPKPQRTADTGKSIDTKISWDDPIV